LQGVAFFAVEDFRPVKTQQTIVRPFVTVKQQPFLVADQNDEARWLIGTKQGFADDFQPGEFFEGGGDFLPVVVGGGDFVFERVVVFAAGLVGGDDEQLRCLMGCTVSGPDRHGHAGVQFDLLWFK